MLRGRGYRTAGFIDNLVAGAAFGLDQGFQVYDTSAAQISVDDPTGGAELIFPRALAWLDSAGRSPFFLFLNILDVHAPYVAHPDVAGHFREDEHYARSDRALPVTRHRLGVYDDQIPLPAVRSVTPDPPYPEEMSTALLIAHYDEQILYVDRLLGRFLDALRERGVYEESLIIVSADHGEAMDGTDSKFGHGINVSPVLHVPLVIKLPQSEHAGRRIKQTVQLLDLYPTISESLGLPARAQLHGRSLHALFRGEAIPDVPVAHESGFMRSTAITDGPWRLVETHPLSGWPYTTFGHARGRDLLAEKYPGTRGLIWGSDEMREFLKSLDDPFEPLRWAQTALAGPFYDLYHLPTDPLQRSDVAAEHPGELARMKAFLEQAHDRSRAERERSASTGTQLDLSEAALLELEKLGYVEGKED